MSEVRVCAVLVAAGQGTRMGDTDATRPKQFGMLGGRPLVMHSLQTLAQSARIARVVVVVPAGWEEHQRELCADTRLEARASVVTGGATRQESVRRGLEALPSCTHVVVHDAARPFVTQDHIDRVLEAAVREGAATIALPLTDTLMRATPEAGAATQRVDRDGVWAVQTPQAFERALLERAHARAEGTQATDDGGLVLALGHAVQLVPGSWWNIKVTRASDLERAQWILETGVVSRVDASLGSSDRAEQAPGPSSRSSGSATEPSGRTRLPSGPSTGARDT